VTWVAGALVLLLAALVQVTWAPHLTVLSAFPNLVLVLVMLATWTRGVRAGLACACAGGLLLDLAAPGALGPHALALLAAAYLAGFWVRNVAGAKVAHAVIATAACTAVYSLLLVSADELLDLPAATLGVTFQLAAAAAVYNAVLILPAISLTMSLSRTREREIA
jgi:rod shape-determining protein MreD